MLACDSTHHIWSIHTKRCIGIVNCSRFPITRTFKFAPYSGTICSDPQSNCDIDPRVSFTLNIVKSLPFRSGLPRRPLNTPHSRRLLPGYRPLPSLTQTLTSSIATVTRNESLHWRKGTRGYLEAADRGTRSDSGFQALHTRTVRLTSELLGIITDSAAQRVKLEREQ